MLTAICAEIKNYFTHERDKHIGDFSIVDGKIVPSIDLPTDYIRIVGSRKNDGVHKVSAGDLEDECKFHGAVWVMCPPKSFLVLAKEIEDWQAKYGSVNSSSMSPFTSESFGGYSYSKGSGSGSSGKENGWISAYGTRLNAYRRIRL